MLVLFGVGYGLLTSSGSATAAQQAAPNAAQIAEGRSLFSASCASCHGTFAEGTSQAPSLIGVGAAAVDFQVGTGRMPLTANEAEGIRKPPEFEPSQIKALAAYIQDLGGGPPVPSAAQVNPAAGTYGLGQQLFVADCAACHNFVGAGRRPYLR